MNPHIIKSLIKGYEERLKQQDYLQHLWWGSYGVSAVSVAVERCLAGKKAKGKYIEKPILSNAFEDANLSEEEKFERELKKALLAEEQWIVASKQKGLPETII